MPKKIDHGIRKVCGCARNRWTKCPHPWHLSSAAAATQPAGRCSIDSACTNTPTSRPTTSWPRPRRNPCATNIRVDTAIPKRPARTGQEGRSARQGRRSTRWPRQYLISYARKSWRWPGALAKFEQHIDALTEATLADGLRLGVKAKKAITRADLDHVFAARRRRVTASAEALD